MQSSHAGWVKGDSFGINAVDAGQTPTDGPASPHPLFSRWGGYLAESDRCHARGRPQAGVLPEPSGMGSGHRIGSQAGQLGDSEEFGLGLWCLAMAVGSGRPSSSIRRVGPGASIGVSAFGRQFTQQWMLPESGVDGSERLSAGGIMVFVGNHIPPTRQRHRNRMSGIGERVAQIAALPGWIPEQIARTHVSSSNAC